MSLVAPPALDKVANQPISFLGVCPFHPFAERVSNSPWYHEPACGEAISMVQTEDFRVGENVTGPGRILMVRVDEAGGIRYWRGRAWWVKRK